MKKIGKVYVFIYEFVVNFFSVRKRKAIIKRVFLV